MKVITKLTLQNLKLNKKRTKYTLISILLPAVLLFSMAIAFSTVKMNQVKDAENTSGTYHVLFKNLDYNKIEILNQNKNIKEILIAHEIDSLHESDETGEYNLSIIASTFPYENYVTLTKGTYPTNDNEIIISSTLAIKGNYDLESRISNYKVVGIYDHQKLGLPDNTVINKIPVFTPTAFTYQTINTQSKNTYFYIQYKSLFNVYEKIYDTAEKLDLKNTKINSLGEKIYENTEINSDLLFAYGNYPNPLDQLRNYFFFIILLSLLSIFCFLIIYNSFEISLAERKKQMGILRSIGASKKQLKKLVKLEALLICLICIPLSFLISLGFVEIIILFLNKMLENILLNPFHIYIDLPYILISLIFILITVFLAIRTPAKRASNVSPIKSIRKNEDIHIKKTKETYPLIKKIFGPEGVVAYKNIKRDSNKFFLSVISLTISIILFITFSTFFEYLIGDTEYKINTFDINIYLKNDSKNQELIEELKNIKHKNDIVISKSAFLDYQVNEYNTQEYKNQKKNNYENIELIGLDTNSFNHYKQNLGTDKDIILYNLQFVVKFQRTNFG